MVTVRPTSLSTWRFPVPGEQMIKPGLLTVADGLDHVGEPGLRIDTVELSGFDQGVDDRRVIAGAVIAKKQEIFPSKNYILHRPF